MQVLKYIGSKQSISQFIISLFPSDYPKMTYLEPFFGSGAVFFTKKRSIIETINDIDEDVYNFFLQLRENGDKLAASIENTPWHRNEYKVAYEKSENDIERARRFLVRYWFSIGARPYTKSGFRQNIKKNAGNTVAFYSTLPKTIIEAKKRLLHCSGNLCQIENTDAIHLIQKYNRKNVLIYLDPPYVKSTRKNRYLYKYEFSDDQHLQLCKIIRNSNAKIILSGYENDIYNKELSSWHKETTNSYDEKGNSRKEVFWMNYLPEPYLFTQFC